MDTVFNMEAVRSVVAMIYRQACERITVSLQQGEMTRAEAHEMLREFRQTRDWFVWSDPSLAEERAAWWATYPELLDAMRNAPSRSS